MIFFKEQFFGRFPYIAFGVVGAGLSAFTPFHMSQSYRGRGVTATIPNAGLPSLPRKEGKANEKFAYPHKTQYF